jgi:hypothetical protein
MKCPVISKWGFEMVMFKKGKIMAMPNSEIGLSMSHSQPGLINAHFSRITSDFVFRGQ